MIGSKNHQSKPCQLCHSGAHPLDRSPAHAGSMARRSEHCKANHGDASERTSEGGCAQCRREWNKAKQREKRRRLGAIKTSAGCGHCGYDAHPAALHFHHRDPATKDRTLSDLAKWGWGRIWDELEKCDVICANCHAVL